MAVCENRVEGVHRIMESVKEIDCIILDDAFQHRSLKTGLNILLTDYNNLFTRDHVIPSGTLREFRCGAKRANIIIVTKCPESLSENEREKISTEINPKKNQHLFFSYIHYGSLVRLNNPKVEESITSYHSALLFSGIANIRPLKEYLLSSKYSLQSLQFRDHHHYSIDDLKKVIESFYNIAEKNKVIISTEKDAMRIETREQQEILKDFPVYYIPIDVHFFQSDKEMFNKIILNYATNAGKN